MSITAANGRPFLGEMAYLPRVTVHDGRTLEQPLAGPDLRESLGRSKERDLEALSFDHLERWLGVLARLTEAQHKAA